MLSWTNFNSFARLLQKFDFPTEVVLNSLQMQKDLELVCKFQFLWNFLIELFLLEYDINWPNFFNKLFISQVTQ